jgi:hypothetical protein
MNIHIAALVTELRALVADLGKDGGLLSPAIYDTAQVVRFYPPPEGPEPALNWLVAQQQADGGWGNVDSPYTRVVPTLATLLALHKYRHDRHTQVIIDASLAFLHRQAPRWRDLALDALPIATEMILPCLLEEANAVGLEVAREPYLVLYQLRQRKQQQIRQHRLGAGTPPTYSWEALSRGIYPPLLDQSGGIGHSPSATAAWLQQAEGKADLAALCASARTYLQQAAAATGVKIPGVVPTVWPITGFELSYGLYALLITGLFHHPLLQDVLRVQVDSLQTIMERGRGVSFGQDFTPDVDETAVGLAVLHAQGRPVNPQVILQFKEDTYFYTFPNELNPSVFSNAHALYALARVGERSPSTEKFLLERQCEDGRWLADKWHSSWLYTTLEVLLTLDCLGYTTEVMQAGDVLLRMQHEDGGWGSSARSTQAETGYAIIALHALHQRRLLNGAVPPTLERGHQWLQQRDACPGLTREMLWLGKELYCPYRVEQIYHLGALLSVALATNEVQG